MNKQTLITVVVAIALVAALLLFENPFQRQEPRRRPEEQVQLFTLLAEEECTRIEVRGMGTTGTLVRKGRDWFTSDGYRADPDLLRGIFAMLKDAGPPELVSINPDAFLNFRVDQVTGLSLRMFDTQGKAAVDLIVGEMERNPFQTPLRKPDSDLSLIHI